MDRVLFSVCPHCGKRISIRIDFEKYEKLVAIYSDGTVQKRGNNGFDVIGKNGLRYQVKVANCSNQNRWTWFERIPNHGADFYVLFRIDSSGFEYMYILPENEWKRLSTKTRGSDCILVVGRKTIGRLSSFSCDASRESFMNTIARLTDKLEMKRDIQLSYLTTVI